MRNTAICFFATLCLLAAAAGQNPVQHTWKVVEVVQLTKQMSDTPVTTLFTPGQDRLIPRDLPCRVWGRRERANPGVDV
jgi:hypothetical protein